MGIDFSTSPIYQCAERAGQVLRDNHWMLATAESCTGGGLGHAITAVPGSTQWYLGGVVSYSNDFKRDFLDVPTELIEEFGAVSEQVACAMASGIVERGGAHASIAVTGIAGPGGATADKPIGLIWLACMDPKRGVRATQINLTGSRDEIRESSVHAALKFFLLDL